ncbi:MAG: response regulator [Phycisphaerae bacterium]|nr:response regulator [Phycisphaerae bacterium]
MERNLLRTGIANNVVRFIDGQQTLDFLNQLKDPAFPHSKHPCLLILDIRMPKVGGLEVLEFIKTDPQLKKIPVIILTTADNQQIIDKSQKLGCNMFVVKPVDHEKFVESMNRIRHFLSIVEVPAVIS